MNVRSWTKSRFVSFPALWAVTMTLLLALFFELWRLVSLLLLSDATSDIPTGVLIRSFAEGFRYDLMVACYAVPLAYLFLILPLGGTSIGRLMRVMAFWLTILVAAATFFVYLVDLEFFRYFNVRLNGMALNWDDTPTTVVGMVWETYPVIPYLVLYLGMLAAFAVLLRILTRAILTSDHQASWWVDLAYAPLVAALLFMGGRGTALSRAPLRWGGAYFSSYEFASQLALNPVYTFVHDAIYNADKKARLEELIDLVHTPHAEATVRELLGLSPLPAGEIPPRIHRTVPFAHETNDPPNVILIIMESFGSTKIGALDSRYPYDLSPNFDSIAAGGWLFTNFYSTGEHTYAGVFSALFGYPHLFDKTVMKQARGYYFFYGLPEILRDHGYETMFFTTHDPHFDNMVGFLRANGIDRIFGQYDYDPQQVLSVWGVPDHVMFDSALAKVGRLSGKPFFATLLTTSNHMPWLIPDVTMDRVPANVDGHQEFNAFKYADWALGRFLRALGENPDFGNTLVVVTSDNGAPYDVKASLDPSWHRIPLLMYNTASWNHEPRRIDRLGSQVDILATVMGQVRLSYDDYSFGHDLLDSLIAGTPFVHMSRWYHQGYIEGDYQLVLYPRGNEWHLRPLADPTVDLTDSMRTTADRYAHRVKAVLETAYRNCQRPISADGRRAPLAVTAAGSSR